MQTSKHHELLQEHTPALRNFALHFTRNTDDADDLLQDTLIKAMRYRSHFKEGTNLKAWLFTIMRNTFINDYRRTARKNNLITTDEEISAHNLMQSSSKNSAEGNFAMKDIQKALSSIPDSCRIPFVRYFEGHKYHEIAEELQIPLGTVKTRIHQARILLQKRLRPYNSL